MAVVVSRGLGGQAGRGVAIDEAAVADCEGRQGRAIDLGLVVGGDGQRGRRDRQAPGNIADRVVDVGRAAGDDCVRACRYWAMRGGGGAQHRLGVKLALVSPLTKPEYDAEKRRQRRAVNLGVALGGDRQRRRIDRLSGRLGIGSVVLIAGVDGRDRVVPT